MLTVNEIFYSIQGESTRAGEPCVFVRLTACDLRCSWCDTPYAFYEGRKRSIDDVVAEVEGYGCPLVEITGGEPLLQEDVYPLMDALIDRGHTVMLETGGHRPIARVPREVIKIVDVKCPGSGEVGQELLGQSRRSSTPHDEVKFVIKDRADYEFARDVIAPVTTSRRACRRCCFRRSTACSIRRILSEWMLADHLPARLQLQLHKFIWSPEHERRLMHAAVVLLSGGLDSYTAAAIAQSEGFALYALTIAYGQRHAQEIEAARQVAAALGVDAPPRTGARSARHRRFRADLGDAGPARPRSVGHRHSRRPTCRRATRSFSRWRWRGPRCSAPTTCSSA